MMNKEGEKIMYDYSNSITYLKQEKVKHTKPHQKPYDDAIKAMELLTPIDITNERSAYIICPKCKKEFTYRNMYEQKNGGSRICNVCGQHMMWKGVGEKYDRG